MSEAGLEQKYIQEAFDTNWVAPLGPNVNGFEEDLELNGPCDMDFFVKDGEYYLSEINPRFGGAYLHAYGAGVDFIKLILNNIHGIENQSIIGQYEDDVIMMMYDDVVIKKKNELMSEDFSLL